MGNPYRKTSQLNITTKMQDGKTVIDDLYFTAPFKVMRPFYEYGGGIKIIAISVSAGILEGDVQEININALEGTRTTITSQSYEKIYKMKEDEAKRRTSIYVGKNAYLRYLPLPTIPFADSAYSSITNIELEDNSSKFIMSEIISCGRYMRDEKFQYKYYKSLVNIKNKDKLLFRDNTIFNPKEFVMSSIGMFESHTHLGNILIFNLNLSNEDLDRIWNIIKENGVEGGVSYTWTNDVVIRILGFNSQSLERISEEIISSLEESREEKICI